MRKLISSTKPTSHAMPSYRRSQDARRLWVMQQAQQRKQADALEHDESEITTAAAPDLETSRAPERDSASVGWPERFGLRRKSNSESARSATESLAARQGVVATLAPPTVQAGAGRERVRQLLEATQPATWVFTGDTIVQGGGQTGAGRTYSEHFGDHLRNKLRRLLDAVVNTGVPKSRCENLLKTLDWRVTRFAPDVAFVMLGPTDAAAGPAGRDRFRGLLHRVVDAFESSATTLILQTPPTARPDRWTDANDVLAYVDLVRDTAAQRGVMLIDHWSLFEDRLAKAESEPDWWSAGGVLPNVRGHVELARQLVEACGASTNHAKSEAEPPH